MGQRAS